MSAYIGDVVKNGLVLYLDAANSKSYVSGSGVWRDLSGNNNSGSLTNGPTFSSDGKGSIVFDGSNDFVNQSLPSLNLTDFSFSAWTKGSGTMFGSGVQEAWPKWWSFEQSGFSFKPVSIAGQYIIYTISIPSPITSSWNMVSYVRNGSTMYAYQNGILVNTYNSFPTNALVTYSNWGQFIGKNKIDINQYTSEAFFNGNISQVSMYNRALSAAEILENYNATKGRFDTPRAINSVQPRLVTNGLVMCLDAGNRKSYVSGSNIIYDLVPTRSISICGTVGENGTLTLTAPPNYVFTSVDFASYGTPTGSCGTFITSSIPSTSIICHSATSYTYVASQLLGKTGSVSISATNANFGDPCSGTLKRLYVQATVTGPSITGSLINGPTFNSSNNGSIVFDGSNDYIQGPAIRMQNSFSVAGWIYHSSVGIGRMRYLTIDGEIGVIRKDNGVGVLHYYSTAPGGTTQITSANNFLVANKWYYVVGTWDGTIHRLYADGELLGSFAPYGYSGAITAISASYFVGGTGGGEIMNGRIAQTKIYNRALTADEIRQNYNSTKGRFGL